MVLHVKTEKHAEIYACNIMCRYGTQKVIEGAFAYDFTREHCRAHWNLCV